MAPIDNSLPVLDLLKLNDPEPQHNQTQQKNTLLTMFHTIPEFKSTLMSMLTPSSLTIFLAAISYVMTSSERKRYMALERQIFKSTAPIDQAIHQGCSVVLVGSRLNRIWDLIRHRDRGDGYNPISATTAKERKRLQIHGGQLPREIINVWLIITHEKFLKKNKYNMTITKNPDLPIILPGTWNFPWLEPRKPYRGEMKPVVEVANMEDWEDSVSLHTSKLTGAVTAFGGYTDEYGADLQLQTTEPYTKTKGYWNISKDITEEGFEIFSYISSPDTQETPILGIDSTAFHWRHLVFLQDCPQKISNDDSDPTSIFISYTRLHDARPKLRRTMLEREQWGEEEGRSVVVSKRDPKKKKNYASLILSDSEYGMDLQVKIPL